MIGDDIVAPRNDYFCLPSLLISVPLALSSGPSGLMQTLLLHWETNPFHCEEYCCLQSFLWFTFIWLALPWWCSHCSIYLWSHLWWWNHWQMKTKQQWRLNNTGWVRSRVLTAIVRVDWLAGFRWSRFTVSSSHIIDGTDKVGSDVVAILAAYISTYPSLRIYAHYAAAYMLSHGQDDISANTKVTTVTAPKSSPLIPHH